jgi:hypothetical protein
MTACEPEMVGLFSTMGTSELVKQLKALPPRERRKVVKAILELEENEATRLPIKTKRVKWPDVEARAKRIFGNRVLPNLVLLEREQEPFIKQQEGVGFIQNVVARIKLVPFSCDLIPKLQRLSVVNVFAVVQGDPGTCVDKDFHGREPR